MASLPGQATNLLSPASQLYALFLKRYLPYWLRLVAWSCGRGDTLPSLISDIYDAGIETMFGLDIIKQAVDLKQDTILSEALEVASAESSEVLLRCLPRLFESYVQSVKRYKGSLFSQGSNQAPGQFTEQVQRTAMVFYASCNALARIEGDTSSWTCRVALLDVVEKENLLNGNDEGAKALLREDRNLALEGLASTWDGSYLQLPVLAQPHSNPSTLEEAATRTESAVRILAILTRIDYDLMSQSFQLVFPRLVVVRKTASEDGCT